MKWIVLVLVAVAAAVIAVGCGEDSDDGAGSTAGGGDAGQSEAPGEPEWLFVMQADAFDSSDDTLGLSGVTGSIVAFQDRPGRSVRSLEPSEFVDWFNEGVGDDPPNAVLGGRDADGSRVEAVVQLVKAELVDDGFDFTYDVTEGDDLPTDGTEAMLVIDAFPTSVNPQVTD